MYSELFWTFMAVWGAAMVMGTIGGWLWWLGLKWEKTKVRKLEIEKIICNAKYELKKLEKEEKEEMRK